jgi:hypothetical protein
MTPVLVNSGAPAGQLGLLLLLQLQLHCLTLPNNAVTTPQQPFIKAVLVFTQLPIAVAPFINMPKAKHTLPPRIASACPNPHCTSPARVFQNVQKHISQKPDCMAYAQAWRQVAFDWSIIYPICLLFSFTMLKLYLLLLHFTGQTAVTIYIATGIWPVPTTTVIGMHNMARILANSGAPGLEDNCACCCCCNPNCTSCHCQTMPQQRHINTAIHGITHCFFTSL